MSGPQPPSGRTKRLPNGERAELDLRKLTDYCLNPDHPRGRHKARVFRDALGITRTEATELRANLLAAARDEIAERMDGDEWGVRWRLDVTIPRQGRRAVVRTIWMTRTGEETPRFLTCWVL
jgi:hypothetical protein